MARKSNLAALIASASLLASASAVTFFEIGDAGQTLGTAQVVSGGTDVIQGSLVSQNADLFQFNWGGGAFYVNSVGAKIDTQLFLFDSNGVGILGNDDGISVSGPAYLQLASLAAGVYYVGISSYDYDPYSATGLIFPTFPYETVFGPSNLDPLDHWTGGSGFGNYLINFQQVTSDGTPVGNSNPVGVPDGGSTVALLGLALSGLGVVRSKFKGFQA